MRRVLAFLAVVILVLVIAGAMFIRRGVSARARPGAMETFIARAMRRWATPADLRKAKNPVPLTPQVLADARAHFADHCAVCHGNDGRGQTEMGRGMYPPAPDMTKAPTQSLSDGELFSIIENGIRLTGMPAWGEGSARSRRESWELVHFVRHLPSLTPAEVEEMERLNPKSPAEMKEIEAEEKFLKGQ